MDIQADAEPASQPDAAPAALRGDASGVCSAAQPARAAEGARRLRAVLDDDRRQAGESRTQTAAGPLATRSYTTPWRVLWRDYYKTHRRPLRTAIAAVMTAAAAVAIACWSLGASSGDTTLPAAQADARVPAAKGSLPGDQARRLKTAAIVRAAPSRATGASTPKSAIDARVEAMANGLSTRMRLIRADALLKHPSERAARESRALLELTLPGLPQEGDGRALLAQACMRLNDEACARSAIASALQLHPRRARYNRIAQQVAEAFAAPQQ